MTKSALTKLQRSPLLDIKSTTAIPDDIAARAIGEVKIQYSETRKSGRLDEDLEALDENTGRPARTARRAPAVKAKPKRGVRA